MTKDRLIKYIFQQKWFFGIRRNESVFFYSAKYNNREKLIKRDYESGFVETILFPVKKREPVRVFNLKQTKEFHRESKKKILIHPEFLISLVENNYLLWKKIDELLLKLKYVIKCNDYQESIKIFYNIIKKYGQHGADFFSIFSCGMMLEEYGKKNNKMVKKALIRHDSWRNWITFKEEELGKIFYQFFKLLISQKKMRFQAKYLMKFLTVKEVFALINGKLSKDKLKNLLQKRNKNGFIYLFLRQKRYQDTVIDNKTIIIQMQKKFAELSRSEDNNSESREIKGKMAYLRKDKIKGEVIIIKGHKELGKTVKSLKGKILVTVQTTPHFIPYLTNVKAIITDEGGITCHAAIISREMKKPCVIGTRVATQVLKDGDIVEVDANQGIIRILSN